MNNKNHILFHGNNDSNKKAIKQGSMKLYNSNNNIRNAFNQKIKFKLNNFNNSNSNKILKFKQVKLKRKQKNKKTIKLSLHKNSQTNLKNYNYKNSRNDLLNYSFCNFNIIKSKMKTSLSAQDINKDKNIFEIFEKNPKKKLLNENKILYKTNHFELRYLLDKKYNNNRNNINIKNNEYNSMDNDIKNYEIFSDSNNQKKIFKYKSQINIFNIYNNNSFNKKEKFINLNNNVTYMKYNNFLPRKSIINIKLEEKKSNWKNNILEGIITNITKINKRRNNINFYDENYNHHNIKMFTILDLYNENHKNLKGL